jgi:hypothetical protein
MPRLQESSRHSSKQTIVRVFNFSAFTLSISAFLATDLKLVPISTTAIAIAAVVAADDVPGNLRKRQQPIKFQTAYFYYCYFFFYRSLILTTACRLAFEQERELEPLWANSITAIECVAIVFNQLE